MAEIYTTTIHMPPLLWYGIAAFGGLLVICKIAGQELAVLSWLRTASIDALQSPGLAVDCISHNYCQPYNQMHGAVSASVHAHVVMSSAGRCGYTQRGRLLSCCLFPTCALLSVIARPAEAQYEQSLLH